MLHDLTGQGHGRQPVRGGFRVQSPGQRGEERGSKRRVPRGGRRQQLTVPRHLRGAQAAQQPQQAPPACQQHRACCEGFATWAVSEACVVLSRERTLGVPRTPQQGSPPDAHQVMHCSL